MWQVTRLMTSTLAPSGEKRDGRTDQRVHRRRIELDDRLELIAHPRVPERAQVVRDGRGRRVIGEVSEVPGDVLGHLYDAGLSAHPAPTGSPSTSAGDRRSSSLTLVASATCTAVTLYSGQLVAQSEFSVVTTLAPLTGWWNVV
jgi:hypothetical protein